MHVGYDRNPPFLLLTQKVFLSTDTGSNNIQFQQHYSYGTVHYNLINLVRPYESRTSTRRFNVDEYRRTGTVTTTCH